ncbi:MAG: hypothetical protein QF661_12305 [Arenicellales bacterium]|nr:hypothetical protein [Arenicellales bacterium]MDP7618342.1 hypothetical protein [Arenicellales bacterium]
MTGGGRDSAPWGDVAAPMRRVRTGVSEPVPMPARDGISAWGSGLPSR